MCLYMYIFESLVSSCVQVSDWPSVFLHHVHLHVTVRVELIETITEIYIVWVDHHVQYKLVQDGF